MIAARIDAAQLSIGIYLMSACHNMAVTVKLCLYASLAHNINNLEGENISG